MSAHGCDWFVYRKPAVLIYYEKMTVQNFAGKDPKAAARAAESH